MLFRSSIEAVLSEVADGFGGLLSSVSKLIRATPSKHKPAPQSPEVPVVTAGLGRAGLDWTAGPGPGPGFGPESPMERVWLAGCGGCWSADGRVAFLFN